MSGNSMNEQLAAEDLEFFWGEEFISRSQILNFMTRLDPDFSEPLINRGIDLSEYLDKLLTKGEVVGVYSRHEILALAAFYCNDETGRNAYLSYIAISQEMRKSGLAQNLMGQVVEKSKAAGMATITTDISPGRSQLMAFYVKFGYELQYPDNLRNDSTNQNRNRLMMRL